jgi:hypothetical protein
MAARAMDQSGLAHRCGKMTETTAASGSHGPQPHFFAERIVAIAQPAERGVLPAAPECGAARGRSARHLQVSYGAATRAGISRLACGEPSPVT